MINIDNLLKQIGLRNEGRPSRAPAAGPVANAPGCQGASLKTHLLTLEDKAELRMTTIPRDPFLDGPYIGRQTVLMLENHAALLGITLVTDEQLKAVEDINSRLKVQSENVLKYSINSAIADFKKSLREAHKQMVSGKVAENHWTKEEYVTDYHIKRRGAKQARRAIAAEVEPIAMEIAKQLAKVAARLAVVLEAQERSHFEKLGFEKQFEPSVMLLAAQKVAKYPDRCIPLFCRDLSPSDIIAFAQRQKPTNQPQS